MHWVETLHWRDAPEALARASAKPIYRATGAHGTQPGSLSPVGGAGAGSGEWGVGNGAVSGSISGGLLLGLPPCAPRTKCPAAGPSGEAFGARQHPRQCRLGNSLSGGKK